MRLRPGGDPTHLAPRVVAWEVTRACNLACSHCRASAMTEPDPAELNTFEGFTLIDEIAATGKNIILILTGGEPLLRPDIFELALRGSAQGLRVVMAPNGTLINDQAARSMVASGISRISVSLDGPSAGYHDAFRGVEGAFEKSLQGIERAVAAGLEFQVNTTVTKANLPLLPEIHALAARLGARAHHIFLLVPTGRGRAMTDQIIGPEEYEDVLHWLYEAQLAGKMELKATCAPHYNRVVRQRARAEGRRVEPAVFGSAAHGRGCLGGRGFAFVSHTGQVQPCGYLELDCGQVRERTFTQIYRESEIFLKLRDDAAYQGKCGACEFLRVCGGCRARAFAATGDFLAEEPLCAHQPGRPA